MGIQQGYGDIMEYVTNNVIFGEILPSRTVVQMGVEWGFSSTRHGQITWGSMVVHPPMCIIHPLNMAHMVICWDII